jgi:endonuclease/exonuclease/phosphatase family metal-dependent hydrolase
MVRILRYILKIIALLSLFVFLIAGSLLTYLTLTDFQPKPVERIGVKGNSTLKPGNHREFNIISWNIGYCGMGKEMDFFYDGGKDVRPSVESYQKALNGIINFVNHADTVDFILLQEVDMDARRSYFTNQIDLLCHNMIDFNYAFTKNYDVKFIPFPFTSPLGSIHAGILSFFRFAPIEAKRYASLVNFPWPKRIFFFDRCFMKLRFPLNNNKSLVIINIHNSAWDEGAKLRVYEMQLLKDKILEEYLFGNYVVVGGDWNQNPPGFITSRIKTGENARVEGIPFSARMMPSGWKWIYDSSMITNRDANEPYKIGRTYTTTIDFFLVSPNVENIEVKAIEQGFQYSDHQPVYLKFRLKEDTSNSNQVIPPK